MFRNFEAVHKFKHRLKVHVHLRSWIRTHNKIPWKITPIRILFRIDLTVILVFL